VTDLEALARKAAKAQDALRAAIVAERAAGRTLRDIAAEAGTTSAGVLYIVRKAESA